VGLLAAKLARELGLSDRAVALIGRAAPLHDIGKIAIPDAILLKPAKLTGGEFEIMKGHAARGEQILLTLIRDLSLAELQHVGSLCHIARHHHERWDGGGYPDGLRGAAISVEARIIHIADVFDALTTRRCYKPAWSMEDASAFLRQGAGSEFDPELVELFLEPPRGIASIMEKFTEEPAEALEAT
jgi:putative two-component system response regulator